MRAYNAGRGREARCGRGRCRSSSATPPSTRSTTRGRWRTADQGYPAPTDATFAVHVDGAPTPFLAGASVLLRIGIQARESSSERTRPNAALTFVIDTSGSMAREDRLELVKDSLRMLVDRPRAAATRSRSSRSATTPASCSSRPRPTDDDRILAAIDELQPGGSTNLEAGLRLGYELARERLLSEDGIDRVDPRLGRRRQRRADRRRRRSCGQIRRRCRGRHRARLGRGRDGQLQRRPARAAGRPGRRLLCLRQRPRRGAPAVHRGPDRRRSRRSRSTPRSRSSSTRRWSRPTG